MEMDALHVPRRDFAVFNALGGALRAIMFSALGFLFGRSIVAIIGEVVRYEVQAAAVIAAVALAWVAVYRLQGMGATEP